ncbi:rac guanine nucleotide exchange factor JJ-like, partial [Varroa jacobsoni]|uniref:rac guanine nucleotide exchange factor JJ-like n=1 Tax=Varroa jacobsoni TaxID=62625 RepID=UPI000BF72282
SREGGQEFALIIARISATINVLVGNLSKAGKGILGLGISIKQFFSGDFKEASETASESIENITNAFDGTSERINKVVDATVALTKETYAYENALRQLQLTLLKSNLDEEDFNEIASDSTRTLKEQKVALQDAAKARLVSAQISAKIAKTEEDLALKQALIKLKSMQVSETELVLIKKQGAERLVTSKFAEKLDQTELDALNEKVKANITAQDALADLPRQEAQRRRDQIQKETEFQIELTRSKKLSANNEAAILTKQLADEKLQLEERRVLRERLNEAEKKTQENQFELFNKGIEEENKINEKGDAALKERVDFPERQDAFEKNQDLTAKEFELKEQQARANAANDIINIKTNDIKTRAEEELKIKTKLNADIEKLEIERAKITTELSEAELEQQRQIAVERTDLALK